MMADINAILVCVDFADLLAITLPYNRHHFERVLVVTSFADTKTVEVAVAARADVWQTNLFYADGAVFNKWAALETGLDVLGRRGWLCVMDADVLWPQEASAIMELAPLVPGSLYSPFRRMLDPLPVPLVIPDQAAWNRLPRHPQVREFAGYTQLFHADDPVLGPPPWHQTDWRHAGGADSFFQEKWPLSRKVRLPFEVLHLGPAGINWCGRASQLADGNVLPGSEERKRQVRAFVRGRGGKGGTERFRHERLG
jgi:hypothetical protein